MMQKLYNLEDIMPVIISFFDEGKDVIISAVGNSMCPLIRHQKDAVVLTRYGGTELNIGDMVFYRRTNGRYILHRIVGIEKDGSFILLGDNQTMLEKGITKEQVVAVPKAIIRGNKTISVDSKGYKFYAGFWAKSRLVRKLCIVLFEFRIWLSKAVKKLIKK